MRPAPQDEELERRVLERYLSIGAIATLAMAIWIPVYWLREPARLEKKGAAFLEQDITEGIALSSLAMLWPSTDGGFGGRITLSASRDEVVETIRSTKQPYYYAPGRFYLVEYNESDDTEGLYTTKSLVAGGLMALYQRCVHLGCRVPFCETSQWFECPCHGSKYNRVGEFRAGPAPRGLDRFPLEITDAGIITVDTGIIETGPPRGVNTTGQDPEGAFCVGAEAVEEH